MPYFTRHARERIFHRYGMELTKQEEQDILALLEGTLPDEPCSIEVDVHLETRNDELRLVIQCPAGAIVTVVSTRQRKSDTIIKKARKLGRKRQAEWVDRIHHDAEWSNRRRKMQRRHMDRVGRG